MRSKNRSLAHVRQPRNAPESMVRIGGALPLPAILRKLGADPREVLEEAGFSLELFDDGDNLVSYAALHHLVAHCVVRTGCQHLGLLAGQQGGLHTLGVVGLMVRFSPDVRTALDRLVRYTHLHVHGAMTTLRVEGDLTVLGYEIYQPAVEATDQIGDAALAVLFNILRALCGPDWAPIEARFPHRKPKDASPFRRFFQAPLRFDAEENALAFATDWLNRRLPDTDPDLRRLLRNQLQVLEAQYPNDFPEQVRSVLRTALVTGHAKADQVAVLFSMHARTLNRRLDAFGLGFQDLVDEGRFEIARQMLGDSGMSVSDIADMLHYAGPGAFTRAFKRWSGTTPSRWRAARKRDR